MAPLFLTVAQLSHTFCPLSTRRSSQLPGSQARSVPCNRLCKAISRQQVTVRAVSEVMASNEDATSNGASLEHDRLAGTSRATKAVHGGERAGRPRVSGASCADCWPQGPACSSAGSRRRAGRRHLAARVAGLCPGDVVAAERLRGACMHT